MAKWNSISGELNAENRTHLIKELFKQCSHSEQVELLASLSLCLKRDFLTSLPLELIERILFLLDPKYIIGTCLLVREVLISRFLKTTFRQVCSVYGLIVLIQR